MPGIEPGWHGFGVQLISNYLYICMVINSYNASSRIRTYNTEFVARWFFH